jgi:hypothetical protein
VSVEDQRLHQRRVERQLLLEEERIRAEGEQLQRERAVLAAADVELSSYRHRQTERGMFTRCALSCVFVIVTLCMRVDVQCMLRYHSLSILNLHTLNTLSISLTTHTRTHTHTHTHARLLLRNTAAHQDAFHSSMLSLEPFPLSIFHAQTRVLSESIPGDPPNMF